MGILDEAIREHLELKRSVGADAAEVARLEREAFGPAEVLAKTPDKPDAEVGPSPTPVPEPVAQAAPADRAPEPEPEAEVVPAPPAPEPLAPVEQPTRQFTAQELEEAAPAAAPAADGEHDELEETPDFLQETPEHDRLWFEQKPPKDFDF